MSIEQLNHIARRIHRLCVLVVIILGLIMMVTGLTMKYAFIARAFPFIDPSYARYLHSTASQYFALILLIMMVTGGYMFLYPYLLKRKMKKKTEIGRTA